MGNEDKEAYRGALRDGTLSRESLKELRAFIEDNKMRVEKVPKELFGKNGVNRILTRLELSICYGKQSWEGLIIGFPGTRQELSTEYVGTPYLRLILYPILELYGRLRQQSARAMPCLYLLGEQFNDVFLRKFSFFKSLIPHVVVLTGDLRKYALHSAAPTDKAKKINEYYIQKSLCEQMLSDNGLILPVNNDKSIKAGLISHEVPTVAGTTNPERLDILGYDLQDNSLIAFELKGPQAGRIELENLFFQGMEHRNWLEENKMAVKFVFDGPNGKKINTRKRAKLVLGFCGDKVPPLFIDLKTQALKRDRHLQIEFCRFLTPNRLSKIVKVSHFFQ